MRTARSLNEGSLAEDITTAGDENFRAGDLEPIRTCLLCEVDTNCTARESLTDHWDLSGELTEKTLKLLMTLGKQDKRANMGTEPVGQAKGSSRLLCIICYFCVCVCVCARKHAFGERDRGRRNGRHTFIHTYIHKDHTHICTHLPRTHMHTPAQAHKPAHTCIHLPRNTHTCTHLPRHTHAHTCPGIHTCAHTCPGTQTGTHQPGYTHMYTHSH